MGAAWYRTRSELRRRWRATLLLALLVGVVGGTVLTTVAGARRSSTAYERFREETLAGDLDIAPSDPSPGSFEEIRRLPQVVAMELTSFPFIVPKGAGLYPFLDFLAIAADATNINRPRLVAGRLPELDESDGMAITEQYAKEAGLSVGDEVEFESYAPDQFEPLFTTGDAGPPAGPEVTLQVTGIIRVPDLLSQSVGSFFPRVFTRPAFLRIYGDEMAVYPGGASVRLLNGAADVPAVMDTVRRIYPDDPELEFTTAAEITGAIDESLNVLEVGLLLSALLAAVAGAVVLGQALARHLAQERADERNLAALGMTRRERTAALWAVAIPIALVGAVVAVVGAVAASPLMPVGLARRAEPDPGLSVDLAVLAFGVVAIVATVATLALLAAWTATRTGIKGLDMDTTGRSRPSVVQRTMARAGLRPPGVIGVGMALGPGPNGSATTSVRSSLAGVSFGLAGVAALVVFAASLTTLVDSPQRYGFPWHALTTGFQGDLLENGGDELVDDPDVAGLATLTTSLAHLGSRDVNIYAVESLKGSSGPTLLEGRLPTSPDEVALGTRTLRDADLSIGDTVEVSGVDGPAQLTIVGRAAFPIIDDRSAVDHGALLTPAGLEPLASSETFNRDLLVTWAAGVDHEAANQELGERMGTEVFGLRTPSDVNNLSLIEAMPRAMVGVLAVFAALAALHALLSTVRRRRQDLAVLRSLGFVGRQLATTLAAQATALAAVGLVIGVPLGIVAGRIAWRAVADGIGVVDQPTVPVLALVAAAALALVVVNLAAVEPARRARRIPPAAILRTG